MNTYKFDDPIFKESQLYQNFVFENPSQGFLRIRAYAASQALPVSGLRIVISKVINANKIIFFEGETNNSGVIDKIILPAPKLSDDNQLVPNQTTYDIDAIYTIDNIERKYRVDMYENVYAVQNINVVPNIIDGAGGI